MEQYISKDAIVAEIERRLEAIASSSNENNRELAAIIGAQQYELINLALFLNTLEVKDANEALRTEYEKGRADVIAEIQKHAWKPSEEQMKQLGWIAKQNKDNMIGKELISLYQDLKKLREG